MQDKQVFRENFWFHGNGLTLEITRLRASKITFNINASPQAQPVSIKRSLAIRVH